MTVFDQLLHAGGFKRRSFAWPRNPFLVPTQVLWRSDPHDRQGVSASHAHVASGCCLRHTLAGAFEFFRSEEAQNMKKKQHTSK